MQTNLDNILSRTTIFEWHNRFLNRRTSLHDNERIGRPDPLTVSNVNIREKIRNVIKKNPRQSTRLLADEFEAEHPDELILSMTTANDSRLSDRDTLIYVAGSVLRRLNCTECSNGMGQFVTKELAKGFSGYI